jgi:serine/threonine-protein kinase RIO1
MTLESLISLTDELAHLNELVMLHVEKSGGFTCTASYFTIVTPVLDMLEGEIRFRYRAGMSRNQMKLIIQDWIDKEIAGMNSCEPAFVPEPDPEKLP